MVETYMSARMRFAELHKNKMDTNCSDSLKFWNTIGNSVISRPGSLNRCFTPAFPFINEREGRNKEKLKEYKKKRKREKSKDSLLESHNYRLMSRNASTNLKGSILNNGRTRQTRKKQENTFELQQALRSWEDNKQLKSTYKAKCLEFEIAKGAEFRLRSRCEVRLHRVIPLIRPQ